MVAYTQMIVLWNIFVWYYPEQLTTMRLTLALEYRSVVNGN